MRMTSKRATRATMLDTNEWEQAQVKTSARTNKWEEMVGAHMQSAGICATPAATGADWQ